MKNINIKFILMQNVRQLYSRIGLIAALFLLVTSCEQYDEFKIPIAGPLELSVTKSEIVLNQKEAANNGIDFTWTTGTNQGTGASISYMFQIDKEGNSFANPVSFDMGKGIYTKGIKVEELNNYLLNTWNLIPNSVAKLEARVVATISANPESEEISPVSSFSVTPYQPVSNTLYLIGDASPNGWDAENAIALNASASDPTVFIYQGTLSTGELKFITTLGQFLPSYQRGADDSHIVYRTLDSQPDEKFPISETAVFKVTVSLLDLTISINKMDLPPYNTIYLVGSAAPNGWDIGNATPLVQNADNPFEFTYSGVMQAGEFKFPVNRNGDWGQDMYERTDDTHMYLHQGGTDGDDKWTIEKKGYYTIILSLLDNTISINRLKLYMVGSATPIGWDIGNAVEMTENAIDGCIFNYTGPMVAGEFKFPVNRDGSWGQNMYQRTDDTHMYLHIGGASDDNKWTISTDGNYVINANVETLAISIQKQ
ncbi:MAG TPA: SusF/SusE family outer membrane protein [Prolixibacteraceae bacterium]|nr:SusF/SusE family outer membrane protein [Prolixibacteraceae bacterium]